MKTEIIAILDRSGSMASIVNDAIGGFNTFLKDQQAVPGEARMTVALFDHEYIKLYEGRDIQQAEPLTDTTFVPRGGTALLDAIGRTLSEQSARIKRENWAERIIVCILTDGGENQSKEFAQTQIKSMVTAAEKDDAWTFIFLAANQDAFAAGASYGISGAHTQSFSANAAGTAGAYASMSATTRSLRGDPAGSSLAARLAKAEDANKVKLKS